MNGLRGSALSSKTPSLWRRRSVISRMRVDASNTWAVLDFQLTMYTGFFGGSIVTMSSVLAIFICLKRQ